MNRPTRAMMHVWLNDIQTQISNVRATISSPSEPDTQKISDAMKRTMIRATQIGKKADQLTATNESLTSSSL